MKIKVKNHYIPILLLIITGLFSTYYNITGTLPDKDNLLPPSADENTFLTCLRNMKPSELNFDPGYYMSGSFIPYMLGAGLGVANIVGYVKVVNDENYYFKNVDEWAKFFLVGRLVNTIYCFLLIIGLYILSYHLTQSKIKSFFSACLIYILPVYAMQSHIITTNIAVAMFIVYTMYFFMKIYDDEKPLWFVLAGITSGLGIATKYSAGPLFVILFVILFFKHKSLKKIICKNTILFFIFLLLAFAIANPYFFIKMKDMINEFKVIFTTFQLAGSKTSPGFTFWFPLRITFFYALGWPLFIISLIGMVSNLFTGTRKEKFILIWILLFYIFLAKANDKSFVGRETPVSVFFPYFAVYLFSQLYKKLKHPIGKTLLYLVFICALTYSLMFNIAILFSIDKFSQPKRKASKWIENNIPKGSSIGMARRAPFMFQPGILYKEYWHHNTAFYNKKVYDLHCYGYDIDKYKTNPPEYFVITASELIFLHPGTSTDMPKRRKFIEFWEKEKQNYTLVKQFPRTIKFIFDFNISEFVRYIPYATGPLFYQSSTFIYKKK